MMSTEKRVAFTIAAIVAARTMAQAVANKVKGRPIVYSGEPYNKEPKRIAQWKRETRGRRR